jgi:GT2 family glycosyltransferase
MGDPSLSLFWVLNPDCVAAPETARVIVDSTRDGQFSLLGGRTIYYDLPDEIQTDGGQVSRLTGRCKSLHSGLSPRTTPMPAARSLDYITGAHCVASRAFIEDAGLMREDYFLYYEEVDWAFRRRDLPLRIAPEAIVYHRGGTTIGTGSTVRRASPFANYFNYRNRIRFVRRFMPFGVVAAITYALVKAVQLMLKGGMDEAQAILCGSFGLDPPAAVRARIADPAAQALAFGRAGRGD